MAKFGGHTGEITSVSFSENGYFLAVGTLTQLNRKTKITSFRFTDHFFLVLEIVQTAAQDGVRLWDLRKLKNFRTFEFPDANSGIQAPLASPFC